MNQRNALVLGLSGLVCGLGVYAVMAQDGSIRRGDNAAVPQAIVYQTPVQFPPTDNMEVARIYATAAIAQEFIRARGGNASISDIAPLISNIRSSLK